MTRGTGKIFKCCVIVALAPCSLLWRSIAISYLEKIVRKGSASAISVSVHIYAKILRAQHSHLSCPDADHPRRQTKYEDDLQSLEQVMDF